MIYRRRDMIYSSALDEIKSVLTPNAVGFHYEMISSNAVRFILSVRTDLVAPNKKHPSGVFFVCERITKSCLKCGDSPPKHISYLKLFSPYLLK